MKWQITKIKKNPFWTSNRNLYISLYKCLYMAETSTILLEKKVIETLKKAKEYERQTYNELLEKMAKLFIMLRKRNQYDEFLHKIQQPKMKELWDNKEDEDWERS